ncbi:hypothetical protein C4564_05970 [Candidatus Microgenomates bacterium]|nr:MAG: hypothetical protein C4564_05970 [Candidatus Microgenomates bacterium]
MVNNKKVILLKVLFAVFVFVPLVLFFKENAGLSFSLYTMGRLAAVYAVSFLCLQFILSSRLGLIEKGVGHPRLLKWHKKIGKLATIFVILHPLGLTFFSLKLGLDFGGIIRSYTAYHYLGSVALLLIFVVVASSIYSSKINLNYENWKVAHKLVYIILVLTFIHSFFLGSDVAARNSLYYWWVLVYGLSVAGVVHRHVYLPYLFRKSIFEVVNNKMLTQNTRSITLKSLDRKLVFKPGQFVFVTFYSRLLKQEDHPFTISSSAADTLVELTIKASGDFTAQLSKLRRGDRARLTGPYGVFTPREERSLFFIVGGVGITPVMSILRSFAETRNNRKIKLVYANKTRKDILFFDELSKISKRLGAEIKHVLSQEKLKGFSEGRIDAPMLQAELKGWSDSVFYVVGPRAMVQDITSMLGKLGVPGRNIVTELFSLK